MTIAEIQIIKLEVAEEIRAALAELEKNLAVLWKKVKTAE